MLQRAASNAYSWWWAGHIRTKQSKWLEQNLQDMEEKVQAVLKLVDEDGDSFAKRAEMYYKKRPELVQFVEDSYRAYRALAERYDHISTELQNANTTIAYVFPEQAQLAMDDDDDDEDYESCQQKKTSQVLKGGENIPKVPSIPKQLKGMIATAKKKYEPSKLGKEDGANVPKSGLSKAEGLQEITELQKQILTLQTEREFAKSSYEGALKKRLEIEEQIRELQDKVDRLHDEFGDGAMIEDNEARSLMASTALKSCKESLTQLEEKRVKSEQDAKSEQKRIDDIQERFESLRSKFLNSEIDQVAQRKDEPKKPAADKKSSEQDSAGSTKQKDGSDLVREKIKMQFEVGLNGPLTITELAENIDELVNKIVNLESEVSSQNALIKTLKMETDDLHAQIRTLEGEKAKSTDGKKEMKSKLQNVEQKLQGLQNLNQNILEHNTNLQTYFTKAYSNLGHLSEKLNSVKFDEEPQATSTLGGSSNKAGATKEDGANVSRKKRVTIIDPPKKAEESKTKKLPKVSEPKTKGNADKNVLGQTSEGNQGEKKLDENQIQRASSRKLISYLLAESYSPRKREGDEPYWKQMSMQATENMDSSKQFDIMLQLKELRNANAEKDEQIRFLQQKLNLLQAGLGEEIIKSEKYTGTDNIHVDQISQLNEIEEKFRMKIDEVLEDNLEFWLRFSATFQQIQRFDTEVRDLESECIKLKEKQSKQEGSGSAKYSLKSDAKPLYQHLIEVRSELTIWIEKGMSLKDELTSRFSALCGIQDEITCTVKQSAEAEDFTFTTFQAVKFQGEILNMKQENNKVDEELQAGLDHASSLQHDIEKILARLNEEFKFSASKHKQNRHNSSSWTRVPLRSLLFGAKGKTQKNSIFSYVQPAMQRKYDASLKSGPL